MTNEVLYPEHVGQWPTIEVIKPVFGSVWNFCRTCSNKQLAGHLIHCQYDYHACAGPVITFGETSNFCDQEMICKMKMGFPVIGYFKPCQLAMCGSYHLLHCSDRVVTGLLSPVGGLFLLCVSKVSQALNSRELLVAVEGDLGWGVQNSMLPKQKPTSLSREI